jgi:hypothetical protein
MRDSWKWEWGSGIVVAHLFSGWRGRLSFTWRRWVGLTKKGDNVRREAFGIDEGAAVDILRTLHRRKQCIYMKSWKQALRRLSGRAWRSVLKKASQIGIVYSSGAYIPHRDVFIPCSWLSPVHHAVYVQISCEEWRIMKLVMSSLRNPLNEIYNHYYHHGKGDLEIRFFSGRIQVDQFWIVLWYQILIIKNHLTRPPKSSQNIVILRTVDDACLCPIPSMLARLLACPYATL